MADDNDVGITITADDQASDPIEKLAASVDNLASVVDARMGEAGDSSQQFFNTTTAGSVALGEAIFELANKFADFASGIVETVAQEETLQVSLGYLTGSATLASGEIQALNEFANNAPFGLQTINAAGLRLTQIGVNARNVVPDLQLLGNVAAGLGGDIDSNLQRLTGYFAVAQQQGEVTTKALMTRMGQINPLLLVLQDYYKKTGAEVQAMAKNHEISLADMQKAFQETSGAGGRFSGAMSAQADTVSGAWTRLTNVFNTSTNQGIKPLADMAAKLINVLTSQLLPIVNGLARGVETLTRVWQQNKETIMEVMVGIGTLILAIFPLEAAILALTGLVVNVIGQFLNLIGVWDKAITSFEDGVKKHGALSEQWSKASESLAGNEKKYAELRMIYEKDVADEIQAQEDRIDLIRMHASQRMLAANQATIDNLNALAAAAGRSMVEMTKNGFVDMNAVNAAFNGAESVASADDTSSAGGGSGSPKKTAAEKEEEKAVAKQAAEDAKLLTDNLATMTKAVKDALSQQEKNNVLLDKFNADLRNAKDDTARKEAQQQIDELTKTNQNLQETIEKNTAYLQKANDNRAVVDLQQIHAQEEANRQADDNRRTQKDLVDALAADNAREKIAKENAKKASSGQSSSSSAAPLSAEAAQVVTPQSDGNTALTGLPSGSVQAGAIVLIDQGSTATKNYYFNITGNSFYGAASDFAQQIGDSIIKELQKQLPTPSF